MRMAEETIRMVNQTISITSFVYDDAPAMITCCLLFVAVLTQGLLCAALCRPSPSAQTMPILVASEVPKQ